MITIDIIGQICIPGEYSDNGDIIAPPALIPGWHVNAIPAIPELSAYRVEPSYKRQVFSGMVDETVCYKFPDEATGMALIAPYLSPGTSQ
jgi:hypothetical protein